MTVWVLKQDLSEEDEKTIIQRPDLVLPFEDLPDLSILTNRQEARRLLTILHPNDPPESINRRLDKFWELFTQLEMGDLIAVPLPLSKQVALAEISGHYHYRVGDHGKDIHLIPVKWVRPPLPIGKFAKHKGLFNAPRPMVEIMDKEARVALRDTLPHSYNRFVKLKWLAMVFLGMNIIAMLAHLR